MSLFKRFNSILKGTPDSVLTVLLVMIGVFDIGVALFAPPIVKSFFAGYALLP